MGISLANVAAGDAKAWALVANKAATSIKGRSFALGASFARGARVNVDVIAAMALPSGPTRWFNPERMFDRDMQPLPKPRSPDDVNSSAGNLSDVETTEPLPLYQGVLQICAPDRPTTYVHVGRGRHRWEFMLVEGDTPEAMQEPHRVRSLLEPFLGDLARRVTLRRVAVYAFHSLIADKYRRGRLFLLRAPNKCSRRRPADTRRAPTLLGHRRAFARLRPHALAR